jgi:hypothetical protein
MNLFLDDYLNPSDVTWIDLPLLEWTIVRNFEEFVKIIKIEIPKFISFDHDLAGEHYNKYSILSDGTRFIDYTKFTKKTGYDCAFFLKNYCDRKNTKIPNYIVHSLNPIGSKNIINILERKFTI